MLYKDDLKRYILYCFKKGYESGLDESEIIKKLPEIPGNEEDKQSLYNECKAYLFLDSAFINHPLIAITLAEKYLNNSEGDINLIDEKLFSMYVKNNQLELAETFLENLLKKDPNNKWTISKKINMLRSQRKYSEALEFIADNYEIIKHDPIIFDAQYKILYKTTKGDAEVIIKLFERIPSLKLGYDLEKRNATIKKLQNYLGKTYPIQEKLDNPDKAIELRNRIKSKIKKEQRTNMYISQNNDIHFIFPIKEKKPTDMQIVEQINNIIRKNRNNIDKEKINSLLESMENKLIKFFMQCQISHSQGKNSKELTKIVKEYSKNNSSQLDETSKKSLRVLINVLTGSLKNIYLQEQWLRFQHQYFNGILNPNETKKANNSNQKKSSGPTLYE